MFGRDASKPRRGTTVATEDIRERLARLPHHAVVAFAARCARRVQPLTHILPQQDRDAIDRALAGAEAFAKGAADARAAHAAAAAARAARAATSRDLDRLIALNPGAPDALGAPIDPSEAGPLGPLWPQGVPEWYTEAATGTGTPHEEPSGDAD
jgi:hypothetical protein